MLSKINKTERQILHVYSHIKTWKSVKLEDKRELWEGEGRKKRESNVICVPWKRGAGFGAEILYSFNMRRNCYICEQSEKHDNKYDQENIFNNDQWKILPSVCKDVL